MPTHDIIDNNHVHLLDEVRRALENSRAAHFAVGYFFVSGFGAIAEQTVHLSRLRLLIGNTTNRETLEQVVEGYNRLQDAQMRKRAERLNSTQRDAQIADTQRSAATAIELMEQTDDAQRGALSLMDGIASGRIEVRIYTKGRLHAKAYIFDFAESQFHAGTAIIGSSNLSLNGLTHNTELNANLAGDGNHAELTRWFDRLWDEAEPFDAALMQVLREGWVANDRVTPYDIYIRTLYHLVKDRLVQRDDDQLVWQAEMPPLANYQQVAVEQARRILKAAGGVFIADVVGLGKTFIGLALLKHWNMHENAYGVIICPASLVPMWQAYIAQYRIWATVISMGLLSQSENARLLLEDPQFSNAGVVLIDESHNFRSRDSRRYQALELFTADRPTILLTATPRNTSAWDIYHQIKLWHPDDRTTLLDPPNPPNLLQFFDRVEPRNKVSPPTAQVRDLLNRILIRRTRRHVLTHYGQPDHTGRRFIEVNGMLKTFPDRELDTVSYDIEQTYGKQVYAGLRDRMMRLKYARYNLYPYVLPDQRKAGMYRSLQKTSGNLRGLMRIMMFKRFESSIAAFRATVTRMCRTHERFLQALERGIVPAGEDAQIILHGSADDQLEFADIEEALIDASQGYKAEHFNGEALFEAVAADLELLRDLVRLVEPIGPALDDKLVVLQTMLRSGRNPHEGNRALPGTLTKGKLLIFTQFSDTAAYLYDHLKGIVGERFIRKVDSSTTDLLEVVARFAPQANPAVKTSGAELRVLVATDVLSEGLNLQDGDHVINYDLHWNPVRLIQRVGRIDRLGSQHDRIYVYNFLPEAGVERELGLKQRLGERVQEIHDMIGEDAYILSRAEQINEEAMYAIYSGEVGILDSEDGETGASAVFDLLEAEELIRQIERDHPDYFDYIQALPNGVRSAAALDGAPATYVLCEAHDAQGETQLRRLYLVDPHGAAITSDTGEIVRRIACAPETPRAALPDGYNAVIAQVQRVFGEEVAVRQAELTHSSGKLGLGRKFALDQLQVIYGKTKEPERQQMIAYLTRLFMNAPLPRRAHNELNALRGQKPKDTLLLEQLQRIARDYGLRAPEHDGGEIETLTTRIVCSEGLV